MTRLCEALGPSRYVFGKDVFLDGFTYFNAQERQAAGDHSAAGPVLTVTLLGEPDAPRRCSRSPSAPGTS